MDGVAIAKAPTLPFVLELGTLLRDAAGDVVRLVRLPLGLLDQPWGAHAASQLLESTGH